MDEAAYGEETLRINKEYAASYTRRKQAEELSRLRDKYGDESEEESSSSEEEDDDAEGVTTTVERDFLRTLSLIKSKDPRIYDKESRFYTSEEPKPSMNVEEKMTKPMRLRDYDRKRLLERGSLAEVSESESEDESRMASHHPTYIEEQEQLKRSFQRAVEEEVDEEAAILTVRRKTAEEKDKEERDYVEWLKGQKSDVTNSNEMEALKHYWSNPSLDEDELFLRDYILNRGYIDKDANRVPTYEEMVGEEEVKEDEDEEAVEKQEEFEKKYNFRFEEPGSDLIVNYPRTVAGSVRREDERRKKKRKERQERKDQEKEQKRQELKRLKNLKRKEIMEKLEKLREITGDTVDFDVENLEGDFDPAQYDQAMARAFGDGYYDQGEGEDKPEFSDSGEENWDEWEPQTAGEEEGPHCEDPDFNMDADYIPEAAPTSSRKRGRKTSRFACAISQDKPQFDPNEKTFEEYFDEYYKLDYEDLIGDLPCRFKYRSVVPNDYGLTTEEILTCEDKELNQWVSVKKSVQYRTGEEESKDRRKYRKKARNQAKKLRILPSLKGGEGEQATQQPRKCKKQEKLMKGKGKEGGLSKARLMSYGLKRKK